MDEVMINYYEQPKLNNPVFIEGLPGVGNVGKLAAEHLLEEVGGVKFAEIYSRFFPPQVLVGDNGVVKLVNNELYYYKRDDASKSDIIFLIGDYQGLSPEGQYELSYQMIQVCKQFKVNRVYTLGGYGLGRLVETPRVLGAATSDDLVSEMKKMGVMFPKGEPGSGIVGASGLLLGLGKLEGIEGICFMGETSGYFVDPKSAQVVLEILTRILDIELDYTKLEDKAIQIDKIASQLQNMELTGESKDEDLHYIG